MGTDEFGALLRHHRRAAGLTQEQLADLAELSVRAISALECGRTARPFRHSVRRLAAALGLDGTAADRFAAAATARPTTPAPPPVEAPDAGDGLVPRQLPAPVPYFTGRTRELAALDQLLSPTMVITAIGGTAGVGKTALAVQWAHRHAHRFPDGQLYVNLRGFDPAEAPVPAAAALRSLLDAFAVPAGRIPADLEPRIGLYRSVLAGKRVLIVLDNAHDSDQVRALLPGSTGCLVVVTSRHQLGDLVAVDGAVPLTLDLLSPDDAGDLLARRLGPERIRADRRAADRVIDLCARLPLALNIVASQALTDPDRPLGGFATELADARRRLDLLSGSPGQASVRAVLSWSYRGLPEPAARTFRLLGLHPGSQFGVEAAASLTATALAETRRTLRELTAAHLLTEHGPGRYGPHDLLRAYASEQVGGDERTPAVHRLLDHYLHGAHRATALLFPARDPIPLPSPQPGTVLAGIGTAGAALDWFDAEWPTLVAAASLAATAGFDAHAWQLPSVTAAYLERRGFWPEYAAVQATALAAAEHAADFAARANAHCLLGRALSRLGSFPAADTHLTRALRLYRDLADTVGQAHAHHSLGWALGQRARYRDALDHARQALALYRAAGHPTGEARALNTVGWYGSQLGLHRQALDHCRQALDRHRALGNHDGEADAWDSLAHAHHHLGQYAEAADCYRHAVDLFERLGDRYQQADTLTRLARTHDALDDHPAAARARAQATAILTELEGAAAPR